MAGNPIDDNKVNIYDLSNEDFFVYCLKEYKKRGLFSDFEAFCEDQIEHMDLIAEKYRIAVQASGKLNISKDQFIKLKKYRIYFIKIKENPIKNFDELFEEAIKYNRFESPINLAHKESLRSLHNYAFNVWLQNNRNWEVGDAENYRRLLTPDNFNQYLKEDQHETAIEKLKLNDTEEQRKFDWAVRDDRYWIKESMEQIKLENSDYKSLQNQILEHGYLIANTGNQKVKIFTPELVFIFFFDFNVINMETEELTSLPRSEYFDYFVEGYSEGVSFFKKEYTVSNEILYAPDNNFVKNLHFQYYHLKIDDMFAGWQFVKKQYPLIVTHKEIKKFGFYSGIVSALFELMEKHSIAFKGFTEPCDFNDDDNIQETETPNDLPKQKAPATIDSSLKVNDEFNVTYNTVKDYLEPINKIFRSPKDYESAIDSLTSFFEMSPSLPSKPIVVKSGSKTKLGKELGKLYQIEANKPITKEYLLHNKGLFSVFSNEDLESKKLQLTNMYKYFTTKKRY